MDLTRVDEKVKIVKRFDPSMPEVMADSDQLRRAFGNLLKNAAEAMPDGGSLMITGKAGDGVAEVGFSDTGDGIPDRALARVMEPLFTTKAKGIGLGLAIVNMIIERHNGTISIASKEGEGTEFTIRLPSIENETERQDTSRGT